MWLNRNTVALLSGDCEFPSTLHIHGQELMENTKKTQKEFKEVVYNFSNFVCF